MSSRAFAFNLKQVLAQATAELWCELLQRHGCAVAEDEINALQALQGKPLA